MNKIILYALCLIYFFISKDVYSTSIKIPENKVYFIGDTHSVRLKMTAKYITKGQLFDSIGPVLKHGIKIKAERKKSSDVVSQVKKANGNSIFKDNSTFGKNPGKLNFAVQGTLIINGKQFNDIILAQGHTGLSNNWWFAGLHCTRYIYTRAEINAIDCIATDGTDWCFTRGYEYTADLYSKTKPNHIKLSKKKCSDQYEN
ncbi:MAG: hypothetical protein OXC48_12625 [Endozoicomonadaceae bacterium]|nr:hypothetical protein [Endozoicomonadaceae bacterium]